MYLFFHNLLIIIIIILILYRNARLKRPHGKYLTRVRLFFYSKKIKCKCKLYTYGAVTTTIARNVKRTRVTVRSFSAGAFYIYNLIRYFIIFLLFLTNTYCTLSVSTGIIIIINLIFFEYTAGGTLLKKN